MSELDRDLERWEAGELGLADLEARHPDAGVRGTADVHGRIAALASEPAPDAESAWAALASRLDERDATHRRRGIRRRLVVGLAAALTAFASIAYAAGPAPVRRGVDRVVHSVTDLFGGESGRQVPQDRPELAPAQEPQERDEGTGEDQGGSEEPDESEGPAAGNDADDDEVESGSDDSEDPDDGSSGEDDESDEEPEASGADDERADEDDPDD